MADNVIAFQCSFVLYPHLLLSPLHFQYFLSKFSTERVNPITYGEGGGLLVRTIRLWTITLKRLYLAPLGLATFSLYLLDTFWQNFSKINLPGGGRVAAFVFEMRRLEKLNI